MKQVIAGEEQMPADPVDRAEAIRLGGSNAGLMNELFLSYFGLNYSDRYMGSFPNADKDSGQPRVAHILSMRSPFTRDAIVASLRSAISDAGLDDITILKKDDDSSRAYRSPWPHRMEVVAFGPSITDTLAGERKIDAALIALREWLTRE